jgi:hypothetical protein
MREGGGRGETDRSLLIVFGRWSALSERDLEALVVLVNVLPIRAIVLNLIAGGVGGRGGGFSGGDSSAGERS